MKQFPCIAVPSTWDANTLPDGRYAAVVYNASHNQPHWEMSVTDAFPWHVRYLIKKGKSMEECGFSSSLAKCLEEDRVDKVVLIGISDKRRSELDELIIKKGFKLVTAPLAA